MKFKLELKPMKIMPMNISPLVPLKPKVSISEKIKMSFGQPKAQTLPDTGHQPEPTPQKREYFEENWEKIVPPLVISSLRKHPQDVLHGGRSLNELLPSHRETKDYDIFSPMERKRAQELEAKIDRKVKANIVETRHVPIPKVSAGPDIPGTSKELYRVVTRKPGSNLSFGAFGDDPNVDVMERPSGLRTIRHNGITHESLEEAYLKTIRGSSQIMRMAKSHQDKRRIEAYWAGKGKLPPENPSAQFMSSPLMLRSPLVINKPIQLGRI